MKLKKIKDKHNIMLRRTTWWGRNNWQRTKRHE